MKRIIVFSTILALVLLNACDNAESPVDESQAPSISFTDVIGNLQISFLAGTESIAYTITNPVADGKLIPSASDSWITGYDTSTEGLLYFTVEENPAKEARSAILTLTYAYNGGNTSAQINVIQEASNAIVFEATYADGYYYGNQYTDNSMRYYTWLTENPLQGDALGAGISYCFDIYADAPTDMDAIAPAPGTYTLSASTSIGTFGSRESRLYDGDTGEMIYFTEGVLIITQDGDRYHYAAELTDTAGVLHRITYTGPVSLYDTTNPYTSVLDGDYEMDLDGATLYAYYFGTYYNNLTANWSGTVVPAGGNGDAFQFDLCAPLSYDFAAGLPTGDFVIDGSMEEYTSLYGYKDVFSSAVGTWYYEMTNHGMSDRVAPIVSGTISISKEGMSYSLILDGKDDIGNTVTASWSGNVNSIDQTVGYISPSALPLQ